MPKLNKAYWKKVQKSFKPSYWYLCESKSLFKPHWENDLEFRVKVVQLARKFIEEQDIVDWYVPGYGTCLFSRTEHELVYTIRGIRLAFLDWVVQNAED